jgi:hypothetical protein
MPEVICHHPSTTTYQEPDGSPEGGYYIVTVCTVCLQILDRKHVIG